jgi:hypothetical protein
LLLQKNVIVLDKVLWYTDVFSNFDVLPDAKGGDYNIFEESWIHNAIQIKLVSTFLSYAYGIDVGWESARLRILLCVVLEVARPSAWNHHK